MVIHWLVPLKKRGQRLEESGGRCRPAAQTRTVPKQAAPAFNLNRFQSKQLFYKQHVMPYLKKKRKKGKKKKKSGERGGKINMCSKLQPVCRQNNFCLKRWLFSPI